jgi:hypothetical protein
MVGFVHEEINKQNAYNFYYVQGCVPLCLIVIHFFLNNRKIIGSWRDDGDRLLFFGCRIAVRSPIPRRRQLPRFIIEPQTYEISERKIVSLTHRLSPHVKR